MFTVYSGYTPVKSMGKTIFFAGGNTDRGFVSSYDEIADEDKIERVYIIKGGSGTGKSSFMNHIAANAEKAGYFCEYYLCGSDSESLDCVVINNRFAILDGTAPHVREMKYPGASSEIIDVSQFWNSSMLEEHRSEIAWYSAEKSSAYKGAYNYLSAAAAVSRDMAYSADKIYIKDKADAYISRLVARLPKPITADSSRKCTPSSLYSHGITMRGMKKIDSLSLMSASYSPDYSLTRFTVEDSFSTAPIFMSSLAQKLTERGYSIMQTKVPLTDAVSGIFVRDCGVTFEVGEREEGSKNINLARFTNEEIARTIRGKMKLDAAILKSTMEEVTRCLVSASENHFAIEKIYISAMDFSALTEYRTKKTKEIIRRLKKG